MTKTYDIEETLPLSVPVPEWQSGPDKVYVKQPFGKVSLDVEVRATEDGVFIDGFVNYRGNRYEIRYEHTDDMGHPKGYWFARNEAERALAGSNNQVYGVIPDDHDYALAHFFTPAAPTTYLRPMLKAVRDMVRHYLTEHAENAQEARSAALNNERNRKATAYNQAAKEAYKAHHEYLATLPEVQL